LRQTGTHRAGLLQPAGAEDDHVREMRDYFGDAIAFETEERPLFGGSGYTATITKDGKVMQVAGALVKGTLYRIYTESAPKDVDAGKRVHAEFVAGFHPQINR
jgi:hypothetical protein